MLRGDDWLTCRKVALRNKNNGTLLPAVSVRFHHLTHDDVHFICEIVREFACGFGGFENGTFSCLVLWDRVQHDAARFVLKSF